MLERGFREIGLRTGFYSSPHLVHWNERIRINGQPIPNEDFIELIAHWDQLARSIATEDPLTVPSSFEILTAAALDYFQRLAVDVSILETGFGGRWDATNAVYPEICAITTIGLDHTEFFGEGEADIAWEKAGILKGGVPVFVGNVSPSAFSVIEKVAEAVGVLVLRPGEFILPPLQFLHGVEQEENFQLARAIARHWLCGLKKFDGDTWHRCIHGMTQARWSGRWDRREIQGKSWIFDGTHNVHGLNMLKKNWENLPSDFRRRPTVVAAMLGQRRAEDLMPFFCSVASELVLVSLDEERATPVDTLRSLVPDDFSGKVIIFPEEDLGKLPDTISCDFVLVAGSLHLVGKTMGALNLDIG
jgi:dihydrofolate synthase/folylpolyglutamate synthase